MRNPYKRTDVFSCHYQSHAKFAHRVSVYHVLCVKKCYPQGCYFYKWFCDLKNKGKSCPRKFKKIGRLCEGCAHYTDLREHYQPLVHLSQLEFDRFKTELEDFDDWLETVTGRSVTFGGRVDAIKPHFKKFVMGGKGHIRLHGYIVIFKEGFIGSTKIDDYIFAAVSPFQQERIQVAPGDQVEALGNLELSRGRLLFPKMWAVDFDFRSGAETWNNSQALVARETATSFQSQPESCIHCPKGALVDVIDKRCSDSSPRRALYCLEGIMSPELCHVHVFEKAQGYYQCEQMK